jgi:hypothetical protein
MGAHEAIRFMDYLKGHEALTRDNIRYVVLALVGGPFVREGSEQFESLSRLVNLGIYMHRRRASQRVNDHGDEQIDPETEDHLRNILSAAGGSMQDFRMLSGHQYSDQTEDDTRLLLGRRGMRYLGIQEDSERLVPDMELVSRRLLIESSFNSRHNEERHPTEDSLPDFFPKE